MANTRTDEYNSFSSVLGSCLLQAAGILKATKENSQKISNTDSFHEDHAFPSFSDFWTPLDTIGPHLVPNSWMPEMRSNILLLTNMVSVVGSAPIWSQIARRQSNPPAPCGPHACGGHASNQVNLLLFQSCNLVLEPCIKLRRCSSKFCQQLN